MLLIRYICLFSFGILLVVVVIFSCGDDGASYRS